MKNIALLLIVTLFLGACNEEIIFEDSASNIHDVHDNCQHSDSIVVVTEYVEVPVYIEVPANSCPQNEVLHYDNPHDRVGNGVHPNFGIPFPQGMFVGEEEFAMWFPYCETSVFNNLYSASYTLYADDELRQDQKLSNEIRCLTVYKFVFPDGSFVYAVKVRFPNPNGIGAVLLEFTANVNGQAGPVARTKIKVKYE